MLGGTTIDIYVWEEGGICLHEQHNVNQVQKKKHFFFHRCNLDKKKKLKKIFCIGKF